MSKNPKVYGGLGLQSKSRNRRNQKALDEINQSKDEAALGRQIRKYHKKLKPEGAHQHD
ncbi:hypothetical protein [Vibrio parahaemolyticus]|uniref:hypothetical protein n=1 Tax=Vibrio parahaemolyticus TaxID=670 RepID=UPI001FAD5918|nr:hypothetical protein [Vibrio parahaemolyticus]ELS9255528.1 hypothetical protein [Vibrio parahaemolyticus]MCI9724361.1 hypothetical protein [Vibrio parahaemolyticus]